MEDRYKRALADLDNYRKRSARELQAGVEQSRESLLRDWLEAVDSVERALQMSHGTPGAEGLRALLEQMESILARHGVQRIGAAGEQFDPERHEAIEARVDERGAGSHDPRGCALGLGDRRPCPAARARDRRTAP